MLGKAMLSAAGTLVGMVAFSNGLSAADLVNKELKPCLAEKRLWVMSTRAGKSGNSDRLKLKSELMEPATCK